MESKSQPHVVYILTKLELGGAQKVCLTLAEGLKAWGVTTTLISGAEGVLVDRAKHLDSLILLDNFKREVSLRGLWSEAVTFFSLIKSLRNLKKQHPVLFVHTHSTKAGLIGRWAAFFAGVKYRFHTVHGFGFHDFQPRLPWLIVYLCEWITAWITTCYVCVSVVDQEEGKQRLPGFARKSVLIRAAVDVDRFIPAQRAESFKNDQFIVGTVSCFKPQKNLIDLLYAFYTLYHRLPAEFQKKIKLQIIGDGVLRPSLENWIEQHGMKAHVELLGWQHEVASWMKQWDVFAMSSLWEGLPCAVIEARLSHLPVVAYNVGGIREVIQEGKNGFLIQPQAWQALADKMELLVLDSALYQSMRQFPDELGDFYNQAMVQHHAALYKNYLNQA